MPGVLPANNYAVYKEFFWSMVAVFTISTIQNLGTKLWPFAFLLIFVLIGSGKYGRIDLTTTNTLARYFIEGDDWDVVTLVWTIGAQFLGSWVGSIVYCLVVDAVAQPAVAATGDDRWRAFICFMFFHGIYYQVVAAYGDKLKVNSLERNLGLAFAYTTIACCFQVIAPGAYGGFNIDAGRLFGSKMIHNDDAGTNLADTWWIIFFAPFAGLAQCKLFQFIECVIDPDCKKCEPSASAPKEDAAAAEA